MSLFSEAIDRRNKKINKYVKKFVRKVNRAIKIAARDGKLKVEMSLNAADIYDVPPDLVDDVYERTVRIVEAYYNGEVDVVISNYGPGRCKLIKATIVKV